MHVDAKKVSHKLEPSASPLLQSYLSEDGPCSPYRQSVQFIRHQIVRNDEEAERQREYWESMNVRHNPTTRPVTEEEYERLRTKTRVHPTRDDLDPQTDIHIARWPQSERHIRGVDAWHPPTTRQPVVQVRSSELNGFHDESLSLFEHIHQVNNDFAASDIGSGPVLAVCTPEAMHAMNDLTENHAHAHTTLPHNDTQFQNTTQSNGLCSVAQSEIDAFALSSKEISAIEALRAKLLCVVESVAPHNANTQLTGETEKDPLQHFSPPRKDIVAQRESASDSQRMRSYSPDHMEMFVSAADRPVSRPKTPSNLPLYTPRDSISHTPRERETLQSMRTTLHVTRSPVRVVHEVIPDRRLSPMEMRRFRVAQDKDGDPMDPEVFFIQQTMHTHGAQAAPSLVHNPPHPEITGQFVVPPEGESVRERQRELERERQKLDELIQRASQRETIKNAKAAAKEVPSPAESTKAADEIANVSADTAPPGRPAHPLSLLGDLTAGRSALKKVRAESTESDKEREARILAQRESERRTQEERYQRFRHNMLTHHVCEYSTERFSAMKLLGRGKFAAVFSAQRQRPARTSPSLSVGESDRDAKAFVKTIFRCVDAPPSPSSVAAAVATSFVCAVVDAAVSATEYSRKEGDPIPALELPFGHHDTEALSGALKIAQFGGNADSGGEDSTRSLPPVSVLDEFEREILALKALPHPHIVQLLGYCVNPFSIVMELVSGENLHVALRHIPLQCAAGITERVNVAKDIVSAVEFMHRRHFMHRDIKTHNVLLTKDANGQWGAKLADLGAAVKLPFAPSVPYAQIAKEMLLYDELGTSGYTAPEILRPSGARYAYPADVFSLAVVLWELFTKVQSEEELSLLVNPLSGLNPIEAYEQMMNGKRPSLDQDFFNSCPRLREIVSSAWVSAAKDRIAMSELLQKSQTMC